MKGILNSPKTKIKKLTIISQQGVKSYCLGQIINGLEIDRIEDDSLEWEHGMNLIFRGLTSCDSVVFKTFDAPVELEYCLA